MTGKQIVSLTREYEGTMVPTPGVYDIDPKHTTAEFVARHLMITKVRGRLDDVSGTIHIAEVPEGSSVEVTIDAKSVHTGEEQRDAHLRSADFFDVEEHPTWTFKSTAVEHVRDNLWKVTGDLTIRATTRPVVLETEFDGAGPTPWGPSALAFERGDRDRPRGLGAHLERGPRDWGSRRGQEGPNRAQRGGSRPPARGIPGELSDRGRQGAGAIPSTSSSCAAVSTQLLAFAFARTCTGVVAPAITEVTVGFMISQATASSRTL